MIDVSNVTKTFHIGKDANEVLKGISFTVEDGKVLALLGQNGSGKSTLIKCVTGVLRPDEGEVTIEGKNAFTARTKLVKQMGVVFNQKGSFISDLPVEDNLLYFKAIYGLDRAAYEARLKYLNRFLNIEGLYKRPYRKLSFGERIKCEIVSVLLHSPKYLVLDEPTIGLDYKAKKGLYDLLADLKKNEQLCAIIITHEVDYIEGVCDEAIILDKGRIAYRGTPAEICRNVSDKLTLKITYDRIVDEAAAERLIESSDKSEPNTLSFITDRNNKDKLIIEVLSAFDVKEISSDNCSLREVLKNVYSKAD